MRVHIGINCATKKDFVNKLKKAVVIFNKNTPFHIDVARKGFASINTVVDMATLRKNNLSARTSAHFMLPVAFRMPYLFSFPVSILFFHKQYVRDWNVAAKKAARYGKRVGLALCIHDAFPVVPDSVKDILVLTIHPGRSGQKFSQKALSFIQIIKKTYPSKRIYVDGGITPFVAKKLARYGIKDVISTSYIWNAPDPRVALQKLRAVGEKK